MIIYERPNLKLTAFCFLGAVLQTLYCVYQAPMLGLTLNAVVEFGRSSDCRGKVQHRGFYFTPQKSTKRANAGNIEPASDHQKEIAFYG